MLQERTSGSRGTNFVSDVPSDSEPYPWAGHAGRARS